MLKNQFVNLNIRYDFPIWDYKVPLIYSKMDGWIGEMNYWFSKTNKVKHVSAYVEPAGLGINGFMSDEEWKLWIAKFKKIATDTLGYKIGEIELGEVGHGFDWVNQNFKVFEEFQTILMKQNNDKAWDFFELDTTSLTELDEIEMEKIMFNQTWHTLHDNLASGFQLRRHPSTAEFLFNAVIGNRIPEFDYKPVSRKCIWALADIGTIKSKEYLEKIALSKDETISEYAKKRIKNWSNEKSRKGRYINASIRFEDKIKLETYKNRKNRLPKSGNHIIAFQTENDIIVYQAYKPSIAKYAVKNQCLGGNEFSYNRMSWIKPNFLWMMYRSGWAEKFNQERILAITIDKKNWEKILSRAVYSSFDRNIYETEQNWKNSLLNSEIRLQWDPAHNPYGDKLERKAIQIGIKGEMLKKFGTEMIKNIQDITHFVNKQKLYVKDKQLQFLEIPYETIYKPKFEELNIGIEK